MEFRRVLFRSDVHIAIIAIATVPPRRRRDQTDFLVMANHPLRHPGRGRRTADVHRVTRLRRSALVTTLTDDSAIAAAAMIGESRMPKIGLSKPAAIGTPAAL